MIFSLTFVNILALMLIMGAGFLLCKSGHLSASSSKTLSVVAINIFIPALVYKTFAERFTTDSLSIYWPYLLWGTIVTVFGFLLSFLIAHLIQKEGILHDTLAYSLAVPNYGFVGYPLIQSIWGDEALFRYMIFVIPINLISYSLGFSIFTHEKLFNPKNLINPPVIAIFVGMVVGLLNIDFPESIDKAISMMANCMGPVVMVLSGVVIGKVPIREIFSKPMLYILSLFKNLAMPVIVGVLMWLCGVRGEVLLFGAGMSALPLGINAVVFPESLGHDGSLAAKACCISHLMAIITVPLVFNFLSSI